jgi:hypothetical protein
VRWLRCCLWLAWGLPWLRHGGRCGGPWRRGTGCECWRWCGWQRIGKKSESLPATDPAEVLNHPGSDRRTLAAEDLFASLDRATRWVVHAYLRRSGRLQKRGLYDPLGAVYDQDDCQFDTENGSQFKDRLTSKKREPWGNTNSTFAARHST